MASILIDGYNLIGTQHRDIAAARERLISELIEYRKLKGHDVTVVFDGWREGMGPEHREVKGGVVIIYSPLGERADEVIKRIVSAPRAGEPPIVITSDREVQAHAWGQGAVAIDSETFDRRMHSAMAGGGSEEDGDDDDYDSPRKGNPHKASKKQRMLERALNKL